MKKLFATTLAAALLVGSAFSATAAPLRAGADVDEAEGAISTMLVVALLAIAGGLTIYAIGSGEDNDAPASA